MEVLKEGEEKGEGERGQDENDIDMTDFLANWPANK